MASIMELMWQEILCKCDPISQSGAEHIGFDLAVNFEAFVKFALKLQSLSGHFGVVPSRMDLAGNTVQMQPSIFEQCWTQWRRSHGMFEASVEFALRAAMPVCKV